MVKLDFFSSINYIYYDILFYFKGYDFQIKL